MKINFFLASLFFSALSLAAQAPLNFDSALEKILERSTDVHIQETRVDGADYKVLANKAAFLPNLSAVGQRGNTVADGAASAATQSAALSSTLNIFKWGVDKNNLDASQSDLGAQKESLEDIKFQIEQLAVETISNEIAALQKIEVLKRNADAYKIYFDIAQQRFQRGLLASQEVDKVSLDYGNAQALLHDAEAVAAQTSADLLRLLGAETVKEEWAWKGRLQSPKVALLVKTLPNLEARPDIRAAESVVNAETSRMKAGFDGELPSLDINATVGLSQNQDGSQQGTTTGFTLTMPLFDRLANYSQYKIQYANFTAADLRLRQLKLDAESQWKSSQEQFNIALATALARDKTLEISQRLYNTNEQRFKQGRANANDLELDQRRLTEAAVLEIEGWNKAHAQFTRLCHALGRSVRRCESL
jgi:outer membrane protein TolC